MSLKWSSRFQLWEPSELGANLALWLDADDEGVEAGEDWFPAPEDFV